MRAINRNPTVNEVREMIRMVDQDGSGTVSLDEFVDLMKKMKHDPKLEHEKLLYAFKSVFVFAIVHVRIKIFIFII